MRPFQPDEFGLHLAHGEVGWPFGESLKVLGQKTLVVLRVPYLPHQSHLYTRLFLETATSVLTEVGFETAGYYEALSWSIAAQARAMDKQSNAAFARAMPAEERDPSYALFSVQDAEVAQWQAYESFLHSEADLRRRVES